MDQAKPSKKSSAHQVVNDNGEFGHLTGANPVGVPFFPYGYDGDPNRYPFVYPVVYHGAYDSPESRHALVTGWYDNRQFGPFIGISPFGPTFGFGFGLPLFPRPFYPRPYWW